MLRILLRIPFQTGGQSCGSNQHSFFADPDPAIFLNVDTDPDQAAL